MSWFRFLRRLLGIGRSPDTDVPTVTTQATVPPSGRSATYVVVGLDFGTSGTKVAVRLLGKGRPVSVVDFGTDQPGFSRFSFPSTIALSGARFLYGGDAERHREGYVFRSLKRTLIHAHGNLRPPTPSGAPPRLQDLDTHPHFLVAAYLAEVLRRVRKLAAQEYGADLQFFYNLDIPVSQLDGDRVQQGCQTALDAAVDFAESDELPADDYPSLWDRWVEVMGRESTGATDPEHKRWALIPESSAIVKGAEAALASILPGSQRYAAIVDVGAGTTDMGWFRWTVSDEEDRLDFFSAKTCLVGCDDVDDRLLDILAVPPNQRAQLFPRVREAKPELGVGGSVDVGEGYRSLGSDDLDQAVAEVAGHCFEEYGGSFGQAYRKEKNTDRWQNIRVVLVGGGSQLEGFRGQFKLHPRQQFGRDVDFLLPGSLDSVGVAANTLKGMGVTEIPPTNADVVFLLPALGLSHPAVEIPDPTLPGEIAPLSQEPRGPTGLYDYEAPDDD